MPLVMPDLRKVPITSLGGVAAILSFCLFSGISIANYPGGFSPFEMWLGDYGFPDLNPQGAAYYNLGCMVAGLLLAVFYAGFSQWRTASPTRNMLRAAGQLTGILSGASLFMSGYLTPVVMPGNIIASYMFFVFTALAISLLHLAYRSRPGYSEATACMGLASIALIVLLAVSGTIIRIEPIMAEWCTIFALAVWVGLVSRDVYRLATGNYTA